MASVVSLEGRVSGPVQRSSQSKAVDTLLSLLDQDIEGVIMEPPRRHFRAGLQSCIRHVSTEAPTHQYGSGYIICDASIGLNMPLIQVPSCMNNHSQRRRVRWRNRLKGRCSSVDRDKLRMKDYIGRNVNPCAMRTSWFHCT